MNPLLRTGAFVIHFRRGASFTSGEVQGRIEHVASGWSATFESRDEMLQRLGEAFDRMDTTPSDNRTITSSQEN
jgi:hypothetical protein